MATAGSVADGGRELQVLSWSFFLVFLAFSTTQSLESSLHPGPIGTASLGVVYIVLCVASLVAPSVLRMLGSLRLALTAGFSTYALFVAANIVGTWLAMLPTAAMLGAGAAVLWSAQGSYLSLLARDEAAAARASGVFFCIYQASQLVGGIVAYAVLRSGSGASTTTTLFAVFTLSACLGTLLSTRLRSLERPDSDPQVFNELGAALLPELAQATAGAETAESLASAAAVEEAAVDDGAAPLLPQPETSRGMWRLLREEVILQRLLPLFFFSGAEGAWAWGEFTGGVVKPALGQENVPLVMICFGASNATFSYVLGRFGGKSTRQTRALLALGVLAQVCVVLFVGLSREGLELLETWPVLLALAAVLGFSDAALNTLITALLAFKFKDSPDKSGAFASFKMWQSLATSIAFFASAHVALDAKCFATAACGGAGVLGLLSLSFV